ncbi:MAG TPA: cobalamin-dependent protein [Ilumatobacteraceae bacterium]
MLSGAQLIAEGRDAAPPAPPPTAFLRANGATSEAEYKRRCRDEGRVMYHMHVGLSTWQATEAALVEVHGGLAEQGHSVDRFGVALDRAMGIPEPERHRALKETGPRIGPSEWQRLGEAAPIQPHLGDYMMGFPAGFENTLRALAAGVTTIGNVGQYTAYDLLGGSDEITVTEQTVRALAAMAALRPHGALAHSNLEDGSATQASHFGAYVGWAALELYVVEELIGARLTHCFGNTIQQPESRAVVHFALDDLRGRDSIGSMVYGNTVDHRPGDSKHNIAVVTEQLMCDIALQLRRPTGHAVNPVPLTEAERIPSAAEIIEIQLLAREIERDVRSSADLHDWAHLEKLGSAVAEYALEFRDRALAHLDEEGVDVGDAAQVLLALRRTTMPELERLVDLAAPTDVVRLEPWKASHVRRMTERLDKSAPRLAGVRVVLAVLEVHDLVRDALAKVLPNAGAEVILLGSNAAVDSIVRTAVEEDADAIVLGVYNGNALELGRRLAAGKRDQQWHGTIYMGGILNQDTGGDLPIDARPELSALGVRCVDDIDELLPLLAR